MRAYILYTLLLSLSSSLSSTEAKTPLSSSPGTCPWSSTPKRLRQPACASPDLIRRLVNPPSVSFTSTSAWTGPELCTNGTCVFTNAAQNGGIALITSPQHAEIIQSYTVSDDGGAYPPPFYREEIEGKGIGLRANRSIAKGEVLMVRAPTLVAQADALVDLEAGVRDMMYNIAIARLPKDRRNAFMAQMGSGPHGKVNTNSFQMFVHGAGEQGTSHLTCYPDVAQFNHDCRPNVHYRINNITITAVAARDIYPGEELGVSYVDIFLPSKERKERTRKWGFECMCALCQGPKNETVASDKRLRRIEQIKSDLNNFKDIKVTAETGAEYTALYEEEGLHAHLGSAYTRAALNFALFGDEERAQIYARRAAEELSIEKGPESGDARAMRRLAEDPKAHWTWGKRRKVEK
ncbi:SET domain-containing protein [Xylariaceae sp. AK1471]|nr:SET domain-containing protein [Xylariaceae sp. AK1471]